MGDPLVSVVIPTYNRRASISAAVQSALDQSYRRLEIVVVDDGSTDGTAEVLSPFCGRIRIVRQENAGASAARNRGVEESEGEIVAFLDSDDVWFPGKLERQVRLLEQLGSSVPCCVCNIQFTQWQWGCETSFALAGLKPALEEGVWLNPTDVLISRFLLFNQSLAARREALLQAGLFRTNLRVLEDYDLSLRLSLLGPWAYVAEPLVRYAAPSENSLSSWGDADPCRVPRFMSQILREFLALTGTAPGKRRWSVRWEMASWAVTLKGAEWSRSSSGARRSLGRALLRGGRLRNALFRRSPWWPRMRVQSAELYATGPLRQSSAAGAEGGVEMIPRTVKGRA